LQDCLRSFGSHLGYEEKLKLAGLQVKLVQGEPVMPPPSRSASATQAEQAVNEDVSLKL
jgi:hypothetical protein